MNKITIEGLKDKLNRLKKRPVSIEIGSYMFFKKNKKMKLVVICDSDYDYREITDYIDEKEMYLVLLAIIEFIQIDKLKLEIY